MSALTWLAVGLLGGVGALARFAVEGVVARRRPGPFPAGTFVVNLSGTVVLGLLAGATLHGDALLLAGSATIGSYTTFSTWMLEALRLGEAGRLRLALLYLALSAAAGLAAVQLGWMLGELL